MVHVYYRKTNTGAKCIIQLSLLGRNRPKGSLLFKFHSTVILLNLIRGLFIFLETKRMVRNVGGSFSKDEALEDNGKYF